MGEIKEALGGVGSWCVFGLLSVHASLSDATSVRFFAKSSEENCLQGCFPVIFEV